jgi:integrase
MERGRPPLPKGTYGKIATRQVGPAKYQARARYRDRDGVTRPVVRYGQTKSEAQRRLREHLADREHATRHGGITPGSTVAQLAAAWLASDEVRALAANSRSAYAGTVKNQVLPKLRGVRLEDLRPRDVNDALLAIRAKDGAGAAKMTKTVLSGMCSYAVNFDAITRNPMGDAVRIKATSRKAPRRALTTDEQDALHDTLRTDREALLLDLPDLVEWMLGTGCRIGEALAARDGCNADGEPLLDLDGGTWEINATLIRVGGVRRRRTLEAKPELSWEEEEELRALRELEPGLRVQERTKSDAGWRRIALPDHLVAMARLRRETVTFRPAVPVLFGNPRAALLRDPRNTSREWREVRTRLGFDWLNSHKFRGTVATRLINAGVPPQQVADHMGHARPSMTLDSYAGRQVVVAAAASVLAR